ncbi:alpha/beta hydrolase [uncultured Nitratireductor sp.]|uniref:alpha/beta fold hydrolase n=1 Tax=uncultured Nitratireductor sp. TaxID=520953 RepID=UPI002631A0E8|nr:alpha/beta hydrolase [uncultured Nitratireductor sp.]
MTRSILFLHGWTMRGAVFDRLIARIGPGFECHAPDMPGHAAAAHLPPTLDACADMIGEALNALSDRKPLVVGWSMGAAAAWRYLARHGSAGIGGLVTVDMSTHIVPAADWPHGLKGQTAESVVQSTRRFRTDWDGATHGIAATMFATPEGAPGFSREDARSVILSQDPEKMRTMWDDLVAMDARALAPDLNLPWLVCSGAKSRVYPASASDWIAQTAPNAKRHVFAASGHSPHLEEEEAFARTIIDFAAGLNA